MSAQHGTKRRRRWPLLNRQVALTLTLVASASTLFASVPAAQSFRVTVVLTSQAESTSAQCGTSPVPGVGRKVKLACSAPTVRDSSRYHLNVYHAGEWLGTVDGEMGTGTVTSWRIVHAANREYLEMTVGW